MFKWCWNFFWYLYWFQIFKDQCGSVLSIPVAVLAYAKLILLKKRNFFAKSTLGCNWVLYVKNGLFGFIFETSGVILLNLTKFNNVFPIIFKICLNIACLLQKKSRKIFHFVQILKFFKNPPLKSKFSYIFWLSPLCMSQEKWNKSKAIKLG